MTEVVRDDGLPTLALGAEVPTIPSTDPHLAIAAAASSRPVWLQGGRAALLGDVRGGARQVRMDGRLVVSDLVVEAGPVANAVISPGLMRRERLSSAGSGEESVLVSPTLPLVAATYQGATPNRVTLVAFPEAGRVRYRAEGASVTVRPEGSDQVLVVAAAPGSATWTVRASPRRGALLEGSVHAGDSSDGGGLQALVLAFGPETAVRTAIAGARHLTGHAIKAGSPPAGDLLALHTGAEGLDEAVRWMQLRLAAAVREATLAGSAPLPKSWLWAGLGACAVGDVVSAEACIRTLGELQRPDEALLLASRLALATGRQDRVMDRVQAADGFSAASTSPSALHRLALRTAADALRYAAPDDLLADLRRAGAPIAATTAGRRLPTVGSTGSASTSPSHSGDPGEGLAYLFEGDTSGRPFAGSPGFEERDGPPLSAWAGFVAGDPGAWARWRGLVAAGLDGPEGCIGTWEPFDPDRPPATTGILLSTMVHGWLGIAPDAPAGRLSLAPRVPGHLAALGVRSIRVGDASLDLEYVREGTMHRFELVPKGGRVPPLVVFEPVVPGSGVERVLVDGEPADVDASATGSSGTRVRLQTPVDGLRRVEIQTR